MSLLYCSYRCLPTRLPGNIGTRQSGFTEPGKAEGRQRGRGRGRKEIGAIHRCCTLLPTSPRTHTTNTHKDTGLFWVLPTLSNHTAQRVLRDHLIQPDFMDGGK